MLTVLAEFDSSIDGLEETLRVDTGNDEVALVNGFGTFGTCADADSRVRMTYAGEETSLFGKGAAVAHHGKGIHLKAVVVMEAERFVLDHSFIELEATCCKTVA